MSARPNRAAAMPAMRPFHEFASIEEGCTELGAFLGLQEPVARAVFVAAVHDGAYARNLIIARTAPAFLNRLLENPPPLPPADQEEASNVELLAKAAKSLWQWARSGMETASDDIYRRRLALCAACPHHRDPPKRAIYDLARPFTKGDAAQRICGLCGCITANKARLATENCPGDHPDRPGFTRWEEPKA
ncbi:MAG: hypothetical protein U0S50_15080 [Sphingopyxis sp.]|uniref:hypothetical protein n=1 Tax=Sphingopyxis sp. TaxID=1908224 RepID=UPI002AB91DB0|nr:hypothetical protein [Sphingopyxis sp.]MDZ3833120.1 hypothetical protein [Sphingopyxis sp.]